MAIIDDIKIKQRFDPEGKDGGYTCEVVSPAGEHTPTGFTTEITTIRNKFGASADPEKVKSIRDLYRKALESFKAVPGEHVTFGVDPASGEDHFYVSGPITIGQMEEKEPLRGDELRSVIQNDLYKRMADYCKADVELADHLQAAAEYLEESNRERWLGCPAKDAHGNSLVSDPDANPCGEIKLPYSDKTVRYGLIADPDDVVGADCQFGKEFSEIKLNGTVTGRFDAVYAQEALYNWRQAYTEMPFCGSVASKRVVDGEGD